jgi:hypothetical protein
VKTGAPNDKKELSDLNGLFMDIAEPMSLDAK